MTLSPQIMASLASLKGFSGPGIRTAAWDDGQGVEVSVDFTAVDSLSCALQALRVSKAALRGATDAELQAWAGDIVRRVTYLLEPLAVLEYDAATQSVLVRSQPPTQKPDEIVYYEAVVQAPGLLTLMRYSTPRSDPGRRPIEMQMTQEAFRRLAEDLAAPVALPAAP